MVRLDGVKVVEDGAAAFGGDVEFALEGELAYLVEADAEEFGYLDRGDVVGHGVFVRFLAMKLWAVLAISRVAFRDAASCVNHRFLVRSFVRTYVLETCVEQACLSCVGVLC